MSSALPATALPVQSVALIGNPNTGKTTLFNALTGLAQHVGNYPGVTVERKVGRLRLDTGRRVALLDLPGTYSLAARAPDEMIAVDVLAGRRRESAPAAAVLAIVDASNLRRNLYLVSQLVETGLPLVVALNMIDVARRRGIRIDAGELSRRLGAPVVPVSAKSGQGLEELKQALDTVLGAAPPEPSRPEFPASLRTQVDALSTRHQLSPPEALRALVDQGGYAEQRLVARGGEALAGELEARRRRLGAGEALSALEARVRYAWIDTLLAGCIRQPERSRSIPSDRIDRVLTHPFFGLLAFVAVNALVFQSIYRGAAPLMERIDALFGALGARVEHLMPAGPLQSLLSDGLIGGVGFVLIFLPQIAILFLFIALLEDCGYMARAALLMDRLLTRCGLSGKSFLPLLSSFACAVPAILAARTIEDRRDRFATVLVAPLMSCSARLPVYILFIAAFVPRRPLLGGWIDLQGLALLGIYSLGILVAVPMAWLLKKTLLKGEAPPFLLELPSYKMPGPRTVLLRVYHSSRAFVLRAGSTILAATVCMWALAYFPRPAEITARYQQQRAARTGQSAAALDRAEAAALLEASFLGRAGRWIEPVVEPLGWDWRIGMAALASFPAREIVISVLGTIYSLGGDQDEHSADLRRALKEARRPDGSRVFNLPVALSIMVFFALCAQCASTLAVIQRETHSWVWPAFTFGYMTLLAYGGAWTIYHFTRWLGWGG